MLTNEQGPQSYDEFQNYTPKESKPSQDGSHEYYCGDWSNDRWYGFGIQCYKDGRKYIGNHKNDKRHGKGEFSWKDGKKYIGEYRNDRREGFGVQLEPSGQEHIGYWDGGVEHGVGYCRGGKTEKYKMGDWENGHLTCALQEVEDEEVKRFEEAARREESNLEGGLEELI